MHKDSLLKLYRHKSSGEFLRLIRLRDTNVNTYLEVDCNNEPIIKKRWNGRIESQNRLVTGFDDLELQTNNKL